MDAGVCVEDDGSVSADSPVPYLQPYLVAESRGTVAVMFAAEL